MQNITPQSDYGCIISKGTVDGQPCVVISMTTAFQGRLTRRSLRSDNYSGVGFRLPCLEKWQSDKRRTSFRNWWRASAGSKSRACRRRRSPPFIYFIATVCASGVSERRHGRLLRWNVVAGGISKLCDSHTGKQTWAERSGSNRTEHGIEEFDSSDKLVWAIDGGEQRYMTGMADVLVKDKVDEIAAALRTVLKRAYLKSTEARK